VVGVATKTERAKALTLHNDCMKDRKRKEELSEFRLPLGASL
jgi:hypothetical protein